MNLNLTILSSKLWKNTYFESILNIAFADKAIVCFIIAIFSRVYDVKTRFDVKQKKCVPINTVFGYNNIQSQHSL